MKVNGKTIKGNIFAYDDCHKIYILENEQDTKEAEDLNYKIYDILDLEKKYNSSCSLVFIYNWKLNIRYVKQFEKANFSY